MSVSESHQAEARHRLEAAQAALRRLDATASTTSLDPASAIVRGALTIALNELDGAVSLLATPGTIARIACRFCARMIMPAATRCGFCWHALIHPASG